MIQSVNTLGVWLMFNMIGGVMLIDKEGGAMSSLGICISHHLQIMTKLIYGLTSYSSPSWIRTFYLYHLHI